MSTSPTPASTPAAETAPALSEGQRLIDVFVAPSKTFSDLRRKASWLVPFLILAAVAWLYIGAAAYKVGFRQITENAMRMNPKAQEAMAQLPPEQREARMEFGAKITKWISFVAPAFALLFYLLVAAVLMGTFNFGLGAEVPFVTSLAIVVYARLPEVIRVVLSVVALFAGADPESFNIENPIASNLGYFVDVSAHPALHKLASSADIFTIWFIVLLGIGFASVSKVKKSTAIGVVFAWYVLITLVRVGWTALTS